MKTRNFLWGLLASAMLVGCSQNDDAPGAEGGKDTPAYVAVNINFVKDGMSRGVAGGFDEGGDSENKVTKAHFFFFNSNGTAYDVSQRTPDGADANNGRATNCVSIPINNPGDDGLEDGSEVDNNVEHDLQPVVVIYTKDGQYPTDMVTVLNLETAPGAFLSKDQLMAFLADYANNSNGFVMSNSVYMDDSKVYVNSSTLSLSNLKDNETDAKGNPVKVYVERLAAKVTVKLDENSNYIDFGDGNKGCKVIDSKTSAQMEVDINGTETPVCVKILGWELNTTINQSYLFKQLDESWKNTAPFTGWNAPEYYRSYWADSYQSGTFTKSFDWDTKVNLNASAYCNENTTSSENTKVLVKALLCKDDGTELDLYQWNGKYYSLDGLKGAIATTYASQIYDNSGTSISATAIKLFPGWDRDGNGNIDGDTDADGVNIDTEHKSEYYKAYFGLENYTVWYKDGANTEQWTAADLENLFKTIPFAYAWEGGKTYYYTDIQHFGEQIGVVRNHHYNVNIKNVYGLGTPVIGEDEDDPDIPEVVTPEDKQHYIAAQINILSWKVVNNDVTLGQ